MMKNNMKENKVKKKPVEFIPLSDLVVGKKYLELLTEDFGNTEPGESECIILHKDLSKNLIIVYLSGCFPIKRKGLNFLLKKVLEPDLDIPIEDYQNRSTENFFFDKYGFYDEGVIFYSKVDGVDTVINEYVGPIKFYKAPRKSHTPKTTKIP